MKNEKNNIEHEADEFARKAAASLKKIGLGGGENYCDAQREVWLDIVREAYKESLGKPEVPSPRQRSPKP